MRIHVPSPAARDGGELGVHVNPGRDGEPFAVIELDERGATNICLDSLADAHRLVRAAALALHMLEVSVKGESHAHRGTDVYCAYCGQLRKAAMHTEPSCEVCGATEDLEETVWRSLADGSERARYFCNDRRACNDRRFPEMAALIGTAPPEQREPGEGETLYCDRDAGLAGSHHAPGPDEGSEVAWGEVAAEWSMP